MKGIWQQTLPKNQSSCIIFKGKKKKHTKCKKKEESVSDWLQKHLQPINASVYIVQQDYSLTDRQKKAKEKSENAKLGMLTLANIASH